MEDFFGWLARDEWLAILRIGVGLWWLESVRHKDLPSYIRGGSMGWVESLTVDHPLPWFANIIRKTALAGPRRRIVASWLSLGGEFGAGVSLTLGLFTPVGVVLALFLNFNYLLLAGLRDQGEQGQNLMMILCEIVILGSGAGLIWGLDARIF